MRKLKNSKKIISSLKIPAKKNPYPWTGPTATESEAFQVALFNKFLIII
jgi:hypothetical protein